MDLAEVRRYARHIALPEVGPHGQERLLASTVALVSPFAGDVSAALLLETAGRYLLAAGVGTVCVLQHERLAHRLRDVAPANRVVLATSVPGGATAVRIDNGVVTVTMGDATSRIDAGDAVVAGTLAAAEAIWAILRSGEDRGPAQRKLMLDLENGQVR